MPSKTSKASTWSKKIRTSSNKDSTIQQAIQDANRTGKAPLLAADTITAGTTILEFPDDSTMLIENGDPTVPTSRHIINTAKTILGGKAAPLTPNQRQLTDSLKSWRVQFSEFTLTTLKEMETGISEQREAEIASMLQTFTETLGPFTGTPPAK